MADYFGNGDAATAETGAAPNGAAQPAANGDAMEDEILVSSVNSFPPFVIANETM